MSERVVIVGAGHAGMNAARALRDEGWSGEIVVLSGESSAPYERPPLSKDFLLGTKTITDIAINTPDWFVQNNVELRLNSHVESIDRSEAKVFIADGEGISFDSLILATGSTALIPPIPGIDLPGVVSLRSAEESEHLQPRLIVGKKLVILGGGLIGLEVAATARSLDVEVTVLERADSILTRMMPASISNEIQDLHRDRGTEIRVGVNVVAIEGDSSVQGVRSDTGEFFEADTVLLAVGAKPRVALAEAAGLLVDDGILVNEHLQTSDRRIYAAGDIANFPTENGKRRLQSWKSAIDQSAAIARNIVGSALPFATVPWLWSDQFDKVVQVAGIPEASNIEIMRPLKDGGKMSFLLSPDGVLQAAAVFGDVSIVAKPLRVATAMIEKKVSPIAEHLADPERDLKAILRASRDQVSEPQSLMAAAANQ
jgi:3-phenylpropionate/trans-cinnamate dioxygenase ferredoxin reductase subunit